MGNRYKNDIHSIEIGDRIRELRRKTKRSDDKAMNQEEFYRFLNCYPDMTDNAKQVRVSELENGLQPPEPAELIALSKKCGVSIDWILTGNECSQKSAANTNKKGTSPKTLADVLNAIFFLCEKNLFGITRQKDSVSLVTAASIDCIKKYYVFDERYGGYTDEVDESEYGITKLYLYIFLSTLRKLADSMNGMDHDIRTLIYKSWKENILSSASNYDLNGNLKEDCVDSIDIIEKMKVVIDRILDPYSMYGDHDLPMPSTLNEFFDKVKQVPDSELQQH